MKNIKWYSSVAKTIFLLASVATILSACVTNVGPGPNFVPGHWNRFGAWVPGHYVNGGGRVYPGNGAWVPGHYGRFGQWIPGHWR